MIHKTGNLEMAVEYLMKDKRLNSTLLASLSNSSENPGNFVVKLEDSICKGILFGEKCIEIRADDPETTRQLLNFYSVNENLRYSRLILPSKYKNVVKSDKKSIEVCLYGMEEGSFLPNEPYICKILSKNEAGAIENFFRDEPKNSKKDYILKNFERNIVAVVCDKGGYKSMATASHKFEDSIHICNVHTKEKERRKGYGICVVSSLISYIFENTDSRYVLYETREDNNGSRAIVEKLGFKEIGKLSYFLR